MKVVACYSPKGGVGKTASAVNFAYWAARSRLRTLLIDLDSQGASSYYFRIRPKEKNWGKRLVKDAESLFKQIKESDFPNLDLVPAHLSFRHFDFLLNDQGEGEGRLLKILKELEEDYDLVILDCPPSLSRLSENVFVAADLILVPVIPTTLSERSFGQLIDFFKERDYRQKKLVAFFTMVDIRKNLHRETALKMRQRYKRFLRYAVPYATDVEKMGIHRAPIDTFARSSQANSSYRAIWQEIATLLKDS